MVRTMRLLAVFITVVLSPLVVLADEFYDLNGGHGRYDKAGCGRIASSAASHGKIVGHIQQSTDPFKIFFGAKDLVYIKIKSSEENRLQVGDRYFVDSENRRDCQKQNISYFNSDESGHAGEVEIICVGEATALGIILKAKGSIISGLSISRERKRSSGQLSSGDLKNGRANLISNF